MRLPVSGSLRKRCRLYVIRPVYSSLLSIPFRRSRFPLMVEAFHRPPPGLGIPSRLSRVAIWYQRRLGLQTLTVETLADSDVMIVMGASLMSATTHFGKNSKTERRLSRSMTDQCLSVVCAGYSRLGR